MSDTPPKVLGSKQWCDEARKLMASGTATKPAPESLDTKVSAITTDLNKLRSALQTEHPPVAAKFADSFTGIEKRLDEAAKAKDAKRVGNEAQALNDLKPKVKKAVTAHVKAVAKQKIIDDGIGLFGSTGSKLSQLKDANKLDAEQKRILDEKLKAKLGKRDTAMSEKDLQKFAQTVVDKTNKLAETPLEKKIPGINDKLAKSPTLKTNIVKLQAAKWKIKVNKRGGGSYCDKRNKVIAIDPSDPLDVSLGGLAHETGHALYTPPPKPTMKSVANGTEYVRKATEVDFLDEGEAQFVACRTTKEHAANGVASKVPADNAGKFMAIYDKFVAGTISEDTARKDMAKEFGTLITSTTKEPYLKYYGTFHLKTWNKAHRKKPADQLDKSILVGMTLFP